MRAWKLFHRRPDGSLGPLFINRRLRVPVGTWLEAESHPTKGYAVRTGWHAAPRRFAPHLRQGGDRVWGRVELREFRREERPRAQGQYWYVARRMRVLYVREEGA